MKSLSLGRYVLSSCVAIALLAGCGRSQLPSGASPDAATRFDNADSQTFHYTGKEQQFKVPPGVHKINVEAWGAAGAESDVAGGNGGRVSATIPVTPGEKLFVFVGGAASGAKGGFDGGADGGISNWYPKGCQNDCAELALAARAACLATAAAAYGTGATASRVVLAIIAAGAAATAGNENSIVQHVAVTPYIRCSAATAAGTVVLTALRIPV